MKKIAVFPGSFDPFTRAHQDLVERGLRIFDRVIVAVGANSAKKGASECGAARGGYPENL